MGQFGCAILNTNYFLSMKMTITRPTRIARTSCTLLDNFFITLLRNLKTGIRSIDRTDHLLIFLIHELSFDTVKLAPEEIEIRVINELTLESFYRNFSLSNMHVILGEPDVSRGAAMLHEKLPICYSENKPLTKKVIFVKNQVKLWITSAIKTSIKRRHHFSAYKNRE